MRIALCIEYKGTNYFGWQTQKINKNKTIQHYVDSAISKVANHSIKSACGGRTDTGVHAFMQVIHFDTSSKRTKHNWLKGINCFLPNDILVKDVIFVDESFHARFSVLDRTYRYIILNRKQSMILFNDNFLHVEDKINLDKIKATLKYLKGEKDFSSFRGAGCVSPSPVKKIKSITIKAKNDFIIIDIKANSFLYHMCRNLVGFFLEVGIGKIRLKDVKNLIESKDRKNLGISVAPHGLYLFKINYPKKFNIQTNSQFKVSI